MEIVASISSCRVWEKIHFYTNRYLFIAKSRTRSTDGWTSRRDLGHFVCWHPCKHFWISFICRSLFGTSAAIWIAIEKIASSEIHGRMNVMQLKLFLAKLFRMSSFLRCCVHEKFHASLDFWAVQYSCIACALWASDRKLVKWVTSACQFPKIMS